MTFTVTYRDKGGDLVAAPFEADSRAALFAIMAERGISAVRIEDGAPKSRRGANVPVKKVALAAVLGGIVAAVLLFAVFSRNAAPKAAPGPKPGRPAAVKTASPRIVLPTLPAETNKSDMIVLPNGVITNKPKTIAEAIKMVRLKPGFHSYKDVDEVFSKTNLFQIGPYKTLNLKSSTEAQLSLVATRPRTLTMPPMPPMPPHMERDFEVAMNNCLAEMEGDTEADVAQKKKIEMLKDMMHHYVSEEGMTPSQALQEIQNEHNRSANLYQLYRGEYMKLLRQNSPDADAFYDAAVGKLREKGAPLFDRDAKYIEE